MIRKLTAVYCLNLELGGCVYPFQLLNALIDFYKFWYERYAGGFSLNVTFFNFTQLTRQTQTYEAEDKPATP
jgi:hypothetical protein